MQYLLGIDLGTSSTKTVLFDERCTPVAAASRGYPLSQPQNGWAEQDPAEWYAAVEATISEVLHKSGVSKESVRAIGLSGQMHGLVMLDAQGAVIRPAILWCDQRTVAECEEITAKVGAERIVAITANPVLTGFTAAKIRWVQKNEPQHYARCHRLLLPKDYIRFRLTGEFATEVSDASGTQLFDVPHRRWSEEILAALHIDRALLPEVHESSAVTGHLLPNVAAALGLSTAVAVVGGAADNAAAAIGTGTVRAGRAFTTIGTSGVIFAHTDTPAIDPAGRLHTFCHAVPGAWTVMGCTLSAGGALRWYLEQFCEPYREEATRSRCDFYAVVNRHAASAPIGANGLLFLPYLMGERSPLLDPYARGVFFGLSGIHQRADMLRAVMEGVAYSLKDCHALLSGMGLSFQRMAACGGGGESPVWRQILADMYGCQVQTVAAKEGGAVLGAGILAGVGTGVFRSIEEACDAAIPLDAPCLPIADNQCFYHKGYALYQRLYLNLKENFRCLDELRKQ